MPRLVRVSVNAKLPTRKAAHAPLASAERPKTRNDKAAAGEPTAATEMDATAASRPPHSLAACGAAIVWMQAVRATRERERLRANGAGQPGPRLLDQAACGGVSWIKGCQARERARRNKRRQCVQSGCRLLHALSGIVTRMGRDPAANMRGGSVERASPLCEAARNRARPVRDGDSTMRAIEFAHRKQTQEPFGGRSPISREPHC